MIIIIIIQLTCDGFRIIGIFNQNRQFCHVFMHVFPRSAQWQGSLLWESGSWWHLIRFSPNSNLTIILVIYIYQVYTVPLAICIAVGPTCHTKSLSSRPTATITLPNGSPSQQHSINMQVSGWSLKVSWVLQAYIAVLSSSAIIASSTKSVQCYALSNSPA